MNNADIIKERVSMHDVLSRFGLPLNKSGAMCCPLHSEKTASFKVYKNGKRFHCFGCGSDGDVITFVMQYHNLNYGQAISRLAFDFGVPLPGARPLTARERIRATEERERRTQEAAEREQQYNVLFDRYIEACKELDRLEDNLIKYKPKEVTEPFNELYVEAVHRLPYQRYKCEMLEIELQRFSERG